MEVAELREILQVSQEELAKKLKVTQAAISRLERRPNLLLESIANYIEALGGRLELHAVLPNRTVRLTHLLAATERKGAARAEPLHAGNPASPAPRRVLIPGWPDRRKRREKHG